MRFVTIQKYRETKFEEPFTAEKKEYNTITKCYFMLEASKNLAYELLFHMQILLTQRNQDQPYHEFKYPKY